MTDTGSQPKHRARSTHFIANIVLGILYLALAVFVLTVAITGTTDGPVLQTDAKELFGWRAVGVPLHNISEAENVWSIDGIFHSIVMSNCFE